MMHVAESFPSQVVPQFDLEEIVSYYEKLYSETEEWRPHINMRDCPMIMQRTMILIAPFEPQEILDCVKNMCRRQSPRTRWIHHGILLFVLASDRSICNSHRAKFPR
ncbi:hypothetical protein H5410_055772 [Solanum commersonii]|uniref:Uncharacterized protein n=1 Tax=Solanum commersonii TaxID=4109 RepID=A0A9J5WL76_SOLCO|nr:hypothetical protein H5410_055772 [Solanum commersonii]